MAAPKIIPYDVELRSVNPVRSFDRPKAYTNDLNSVEFQFKVLDITSTELTTATAVTLVYMRDGSFFANPSTDVSRVGNVFSYLLKENEGNHAGVAQIQLVVTVDGMKLASKLFDFEIINGLETKVAQEVMIQDWTTLTAEAQVYLDQMAEKHALADADHTRAETDHTTAVADHTTATSDHTTALADHAVTADMIMNATNLVTNGDFSNGTTGWYGVQSELITANNILSVVGNGVGPVSIFAQQTNTDYIMRNMYYVKARLRITGSQCIAAVVYINSTTQGDASYIDAVNIQNYPIVNQWYEINAIVIPTVDFGGKVRIGGYHNYPTAEDTLGKTMDVQYAALIDLTAAFGAGNEPTVEQMDRLLTQFPNSWFDGTENLFLAKWALNELRRLDNEKANKDQEAWITPTLVNGATGTIQYMRDDLGFVHFKGSLTAPVGAVETCLTLPIGYRPLASSYHAGQHSETDATSRVMAWTNGYFYVGTSAASETVMVDGFTFRAEV